jgi:hypothetical protein
MTRDVAALLASSTSSVCFSMTKMKVQIILQTMGGTPVVIGSSYSGAGPTDAALVHTETPTASDTNKWMYATGTCSRSLLGDIRCSYRLIWHKVITCQATQNDMRFKAIRPAAVYFDTSVHLAIRVDLTA